MAWRSARIIVPTCVCLAAGLVAVLSLGYARDAHRRANEVNAVRRREMAFATETSHRRYVYSAERSMIPGLATEGGRELDVVLMVSGCERQSITEPERCFFRSDGIGRIGSVSFANVVPTSGTSDIPRVEALIRDVLTQLKKQDDCWGKMIVWPVSASVAYGVLPHPAGTVTVIAVQDDNSQDTVNLYGTSVFLSSVSQQMVVGHTSSGMSIVRDVVLGQGCTSPVGPPRDGGPVR